MHLAFGNLTEEQSRPCVVEKRERRKQLIMKGGSSTVNEM